MKYYCQYCGYSSTRKYNLDRHCNNCHFHDMHADEINYYVNRTSNQTSNVPITNATTNVFL